MSRLNDQFDLLAKLLDVASMRHQALAQNVANVNTPGYHRKDVSFEDAFAKALGAGQESAAVQVTPRLVEPTGGAERADGNNVDIDVEMGRLDKNATLYKIYSQLLAGQLATMRTAITGH